MVELFNVLSLVFVSLATMNCGMTIDDISSLRQNHVYIRDEVTLLKIIRKFVQDGTSNLQIVTDFDLTLTKQHIDGKHALSSFGMFRKCKQLPEEYLEEAKHLYDKYRPMEIDPHLSLHEKSIAMSEWMQAASNLLKGFEFDSNEIKEVARTFDNILRDGTTEMFEKLYNVNVPVIVFSAGLGDMVEAVLRYHNALFDNVKVISNFLKYNGKQLDGFKNDVMIHAYNKNKCAVAEDSLKVLGSNRQNVLLMGDTTGDADMIEEIENRTDKTVLKIGFLYEHVEASLEAFMKKFDIVLVDDQTMRVPMEILQLIL